MRLFIFFDIDDTLYRRSVPFCRAAEAFFGDRKESRCAAGDVSLCTQQTASPAAENRANGWKTAFRMTQKRCEEVYFPVLRGEMTAEEGFIFRFQKGFEDAGIYLTRQEALAFRDAYQEAQKQITPDPAAKRLLEACRDCYDGIGLITNGKGPHQRAKIRQLGLGGLVDSHLIVISGELGIDKPDLRIFEHAAKLADAVPGQLTYVGDSMENDILPARAAGWNVVYWDWNNTEQAAKEILRERRGEPCG